MAHLPAGNGDAPWIDLWKARDKGGGSNKTIVSLWGPTLMVTNDKTIVALAEVDRSGTDHDGFMALRRSHDGGATWEFMDRVTAHGSGYSDMHVIPTTGEGSALAVLFQRTLWEAGIEGGGYNLAWVTIPLQK